MAKLTEKLLPAVASIIFMASMAGAATLDVQEDDREIWTNNQDNTINGYYQCQSAEENNLDLYSPDGNRYSIGAENHEGNFSFDLSEIQITEYGEYELELNCKNQNDSGSRFITSKESVFVKKLSVWRLEPLQDFSRYAGDSFSVTYNASDGKGEVDLSQDANFDIRFSSGLELEQGYPASNSRGTTFKVRVPSSASPGEKVLFSTITYTSDSGETVKARTENFGELRIDVQRPWQAELLNRTPESGEVTYSQLSQDIRSLSVRTKITRRGEPRNTLSSDDFYVTVKDADGNVIREEKEWWEAELGSSAGEYNLELKSLPSLDYGKYTFEVGADQVREDITNFTVYNYITLEGRMTDASGKAVDANIVAERNGLSYQFERRPRGQYEGNLLPGTYNFTIQFPQATLRVRGVELDGGETGTIRYDDIPLNELEGQLQGVTVLNAVSVVFGYPFDSASISLNYDPSRVNFQNVRVFECTNWNFGSRSCFNEFESIEIGDGQVSPTSGLVNFPVEVLNVSKDKNIIMNGYMAVRNTEMELSSVNLGSERVPLGGSTEITGSVKTPSGTPVSGADITISLIGSDGVIANATTRTAGAGDFGTNIRVPDETGVYGIRVSGEKKPYSGFSTEISQSIQTYIERGVTVQAPETVELYPGETTEVPITILNSGQAPVKGAAMRINGLNREWYTFRNTNWGSLSPGQSESAVLEITLPGDYCADRCKEYPKFRVEGIGSSDGEEVNDIVPVQSVVTKEKDQNNASAEQQERSQRDDQRSSPLPSVGAPNVGKFLERQSSLNVALGLMIVFTLALAGAVKHKKSGDSGGRSAGGRGGRAGGSAGGRPQVSKPAVNPEEPKEDTSEPDVEGDGDDSGEQEDEAADQFACEVCGEEFDSDSARELHQQAVH